MDCILAIFKGIGLGFTLLAEETHRHPIVAWSLIVLFCIFYVLTAPWTWRKDGNLWHDLKNIIKRTKRC